MSKPEETTKRAIALIVAAGEGERLGGSIPKPYICLGGMSILRRSILAFVRHNSISDIQVVIHKHHESYYKKAVVGLELMPPVVGGTTRQESVRLGLQAIKPLGAKNVLIHDAARPFVSEAVINRVLEGLETHAAVLPALPVVDSLKKVEKDVIAAAIDRSGVYAAQTPQGFHFTPLYAAHQTFKDELVTDDTSLVAKAGLAVQVVAGDRHNTKITTRDDVTHMQQLIESAYETRVGQGVDVHKLLPFAENVPAGERYITLCGVKVPHSHYLEGHSDADVGLHAITDAVLGAISAQDIGFHFPARDERWKGADSSRFLQHAAALLAEKQGRIVHVDVTIICEHPKIVSHRDVMIKHVANLLELNLQRVSVKATTTETLGFTGRGEGIAAQAVVTISLPGEVL